MEKTVTVGIVPKCKDDRLRRMYVKVIIEPNNSLFKKGFIKCPECNEEIFIMSSLEKMNQAIENHVHVHKELLKNSPLVKYNTSINIRLDLAQQVLQQTFKFA